MAYENQHSLFERIKQKLDPNLSFVDEVADLLGLSNDSVYRRLRGETALTFEEALVLAGHFGIALEDFSRVKNKDSVLFGRSTFRGEASDFDEYLTKTEQYLKAFAEAKTKTCFFAAKDIPVFHFFQFPEFAEFKLFFWLKTMHGNAAIKSAKFDFNIIPETILKKAIGLAKLYFTIPTVELWNDDTVNTAIRQIQYFSEAGWMTNESVTKKLCDKLIELVELLAIQAESNSKFWNGNQVRPETSFDLYYNELTVLDNSLLFKSESSQLALVGYHSMDYLFTSHAGFCSESDTYFQKQMRKSIKISGTAEKERIKFFNRIYEKINALKQK
ncbi:MAG: hypothetical protein IPO83_10125 [Chitinophagaceae bacterium]|nr:hypothetical protein [Chitinophagaceae bacterium]